MYLAEIVEIAIGLVLVYLTVSLACSQIQEWLARWFNFRAKDLEDVISRMIQNPSDTSQRLSRLKNWLPRTFLWHNFRESLPGKGLIHDLYAHPLIAPLIRPGRRAGIGPEQIPSNTFAEALLDVVMKHGTDARISAGVQPRAISGVFGDLWKSDPFLARPPVERRQMKAHADRIVKQAEKLVKQNNEINRQADGAADAVKIAKDFSQLECSVKGLADTRPKWLQKLRPINEDIAAVRQTAIGLTKKIEQMQIATVARKEAEQTPQRLALSNEYAAFIAKYQCSAAERQILLKALTAIGPLALEQLRRGAESLETTAPDLSRALKNFLNRAEADGVSVEKALADTRAETEKWFNDTMERATIWYKLNVQKVIFVIGLLLALLLNIDSISITQALWREPTLRQAVADQAKLALVTTSPPGAVGSSATISLTQVISVVTTSLNELNLPVGWTLSELGKDQHCSLISFSPKEAVCLTTSEGDRVIANAPSDIISWLLKMLGLLATALAVSQGAPFWYDILAKLVNIGQSTLKERAKPDQSP